MACWVNLTTQLSPRDRQGRESHMSNLTVDIDVAEDATRNHIYAKRVLHSALSDTPRRQQ